MNIFYLDSNPEKSAKYHNDKHVVKMILEYAQLLSTAHRVLDGTEYFDLSSNNRKIKRYKLNDDREQKLYKATHVNHPSAAWVRESTENYYWLYKMFHTLCNEYTYRYGKVHKSSELLLPLGFYPKNLKEGKRTKVPQAMPDYCKDEDPVIGYRTYYILEKSKINKYTKRKIPDWLNFPKV